MASFLMAIADPDVGLLSFLVSTMVNMLRVVPLKKMWLSGHIQGGNDDLVSTVTVNLLSNGAHDHSCGHVHTLRMETHTLDKSFAFKAVQLLARFHIPQLACFVVRS